MSSLPSFLRPLEESFSTTAAISPSNANFTDFLRTEASKAGLLKADTKVDKCRFMLVGTHAHQFTGYSKVTYNMIKELSKEDSWLDIIHFGFQKNPQIPPLYRPYPPSVKVIDTSEFETKDVESSFGFRYLPEVIRKEQPHVVMIYNDMSVIAQFLETIRKSGIPRTFKIWIYLDQVYPMQPQPFLDIINRDADRVFAFTSYWKKVIKDQGINRPIDVIAHGFDSDIFKPVSKTESRKLMGIPLESFIYMSMNRNTPRKRYDLLIMAFAELVVKYPTKPVFLLCICDKGEKGGFLLFDIYLRELRRLGVEVDRYASRLILSAKEMSFRDEEVNMFYNVADVGLSCAEGEGFGLCNFEQMGVGIPQIVPDVGGFKEYCNSSNSIVVKTSSRYYLPLANSPVSGEASAVDPHDFCIAMEKYLNDSTLRESHGKSARETVLKYKWSLIFGALIKKLKSEHREILEDSEE